MSTTNDLGKQRKVVLVTGASSGIGRAIAAHLAGNGLDKDSLNNAKQPTLQVTYLELCEVPASPANRVGSERIGVERMTRTDYLALYVRVGAPLRWDQRLLMPERELEVLLAGGCLGIYVLRNVQGEALGFCEFDRGAFPEIELKNFGLIPEVYGRGLGPWLLSVALWDEWQSHPTRIWLHTDTWDHPAALRLYRRLGFQVYAVRDEAREGL